MISDPCTHMSLSPACLCFLEFNFSHISKLWLSGEGAWWIMSVSLYVDEYEKWKILVVLRVFQMWIDFKDDWWFFLEKLWNCFFAICFQGDFMKPMIW